MAEKNKTVTILVTTMIVVVLAVAFLSSIADQTALNTQKTPVADETYNLTAVDCYIGGEVNESSPNCALTVTYAPTGWKATDSDCYLSDVVVTNTTGVALTLDTDYTLDATNGIVTMLNTTDTNETTLNGDVLIDYSYCGDSYIAESWGRSILNTNVGLFAIAILLAVVLIVYILLGKKEEE